MRIWKFYRKKDLGKAQYKIRFTCNFQIFKFSNFQISKFSNSSGAFLVLRIFKFQVLICTVRPACSEKIYLIFRSWYIFFQFYRFTVYGFSMHNSIRTLWVFFGCKKQTSLLSAPGLGSSFNNLNPAAVSLLISCSISDTAKAIW